MNQFRKAQSLFSVLAFMIVFSSAKISVDQRSTTFTDYIEELSEDLRISKDENLLFVFDKGLFELRLKLFTLPSICIFKVGNVFFIYILIPNCDAYDSI